MKSVFNLFVLTLLICANAQAREIVLIENLSEKKDGDILKEILIKKFNIPESFITVKNIGRSCKKNPDAIMQLCLKNETDFDVIKMDYFVMNNILKNFNR